MRRMCGHSLCLLLALVAVTVSRGQSNGADTLQAGRHAFFLHAGGGLSWYPRTVGTPKHLETSTTTLWPMATARLMWQPDHRLRIGIESGWTTFFGYAIDGPGLEGRVRLNAVPLLLMWSMNITDRFSLYAGYGTYRLTSELDYAGTVRTGMFSLGYAAALSYVQPIGDRIGIEAEVEWMNAAETRHTLLCLQTRLVWKLFERWS